MIINHSVSTLMGWEKINKIISANLLHLQKGQKGHFTQTQFFLVILSGVKAQTLKEQTVSQIRQW